jgi:hypothetical protein
MTGEATMKHLVFALQFKGNAGPVQGAEGKLWAKTTATSQTLRTVIGSKGVEPSVDTTGPGSATFESTVQMIGEGTFQESGSIGYGGAGKLTFKTVGSGILGPSPVEGLQRGAVIWEVTGGDGQFIGVSGLITSNFSVGAEGQVVDNQFAQLFLAA